MSIRRGTAYLGLLIGVALLIWAGLVRYQVYYIRANDEGISDRTMSISGFGIVFETARDGLARGWQGQLLSRRYRLAIDPTGAEQIIPNKAKDADTCYT